MLKCSTKTEVPRPQFRPVTVTLVASTPAELVELFHRFELPLRTPHVSLAYQSNWAGKVMWGHDMTVRNTVTDAGAVATMLMTELQKQSGAVATPQRTSWI